MKFEEALSMIRDGVKFKCGDNEGHYEICRLSIFESEQGETIHLFQPNNRHDIFSWGIDGHSLLSNEWQPYQGITNTESPNVESFLAKAIEQKIFNYFMDITKPFTPENALLCPHAKPLAQEIINLLRKFLKEDNKNK